LRRACADSLKRLRVECSELYQLHAVDHRIPIEDSLGALVDLQREGKIRHIGVSNVSERALARARAVTAIVSVQNHYNLRDRSSDRLVDLCSEAGMAFIPWLGWQRADSGSRLIHMIQAKTSARVSSPNAASSLSSPPIRIAVTPLMRAKSDDLSLEPKSPTPAPTVRSTRHYCPDDCGNAA